MTYNCRGYALCYEIKKRLFNKHIIHLKNKSLVTLTILEKKCLELQWSEYLNTWFNLTNHIEEPR